MRVLVTGASGLFGTKLAEIASKKGYEVYSGYSQDQPAHGKPICLDVSDKNQVETVFKKIRPEVVVHAAALTDVDKCETNKELASRINVEGTRNIAQAVKTGNAFLVYISTDYVFNGEKGQYTETDQPSPINYYGLTKLQAEEIIENSQEYCIVRPSVIYGATPAAGKINFALWVINKLQRNEQINIVTDQWNTPTLNTNLAEMTLEVIERKITGIFHLSGATRINRYDFAQLIAKTFNLDPNLIKPALTANFQWPAKRPPDSSLNTKKAQQTLKTKPLQITIAIEKMKQEISH